MLHVLILISYRHRLIHHCYLLKVEVVAGLAWDACSCGALLLPHRISSRHVVLVMMEVCGCVVLLPDLKVVMLVR